MGLWSSDRARWERVCALARRRGARYVALASPWPQAPSLPALRAAQPQEPARCWWRSGELALVASGCVHELHLREEGQARFERASRWLERLRQQLDEGSAAAHVTLVGGFAFDAEPTPPSSPWRGFDELRLWAPRLMWRQAQGQRWAHAALWVSPGEPAERVAQRVAALEDELTRWAQRAAAVEERPRPARAEGLALGAGAPQDQVQDQASAQAYAALVDEAAAQLSQPEQALQKIVLARALKRPSPGLGAMPALMERLERDFTACHLFALSPPGGPLMPWLVGASPECLVRRRGDQVYVDALAGTAPADADPQALIESAKDRHEHQLVIQAIEEALDGLGLLHRPQQPQVDHLANVMHLRTPMTLTLSSEHAQMSALALAQRLHPTPAVCGLPRQLALERLRRVEGLERGWYTGALGWMTLDGEGELAVAIRCALVSQSAARVYVGAGVVAASCGASEAAETAHKARAILDRLEPSEASYD